MTDEAPFDLSLVQGETYTRTFSYADDGQTQLFTGLTPLAQIRQHESTDSLLALDLAPYFTVSEDELTLSLRIPATVTATLDPSLFKGRGGAYWDLFLVDALDPTNADRFLSGRATLDPAATRTVSP